MDCSCLHIIGREMNIDNEEVNKIRLHAEGNEYELLISESQWKII